MAQNPLMTDTGFDWDPAKQYVYLPNVNDTANNPHIKEFDEIAPGRVKIRVYNGFNSGK